MLLVYYNPSKDKFYLKYYKYINRSYFVGFKNQYEHEVIKIYIIKDKELISVNNVDDYFFNRHSRKPSLKEKVINRIVDLLYKI